MFVSGYIWYSSSPGGAGGGVTSVNGFTGAVTLDTGDVPESGNLYFTDLRAISAVVTQTITNGVTDKSPSEDAVFDALQLYSLTTHQHVVSDITNFNTEFDSRFNTDFALKTTDNLTEGSTNKYYHTSLFLADFSLMDTDNLPAGAINKYYTAATTYADLVAASVTAGDISHFPSSDAIISYVSSSTSNFANKQLSNLSGTTAINLPLYFSNSSPLFSLGIEDRVVNGAGNLINVSAQDALGTDQIGGNVTVKAGLGTGNPSTSLNNSGSGGFYFSSASVSYYAASSSTLATRENYFKVVPKKEKGSTVVLGAETGFNAEFRLVDGFANPTGLPPTTAAGIVFNHNPTSAFGTTLVSYLSGAALSTSHGGDLWLRGGDGTTEQGNVVIDGTLFQLETKASSDPTGTAGSIYYNTTSNTLRYHNGTSWAAIGPSYPFASSIVDGILSSADWNTFNSKQSALTFGNVTSTTTGLSITGGTGSVVGSGLTVDIQNASTSQNGLLTSTDWNTFNSKQSALTFGSISSPNTAITVVSGNNSTVGPNVTIDIADASTTVRGLLSNTDYTTFNNKVSVSETSFTTALTLSSSGIQEQVFTNTSNTVISAIPTPSISTFLYIINNSSNDSTLTLNPTNSVGGFFGSSVELLKNEVVCLIYNLASAKWYKV